MKGCRSSPALLSRLTPAHAGAWGCSSPGAGGGIASAQAGCSLLTCLDLKDEEFMWSLQWCTQACSCAENVLDGFIFPSAGQVQTLFSA